MVHRSAGLADKPAALGSVFTKILRLVAARRSVTDVASDRQDPHWTSALAALLIAGAVGFV